MPFYRNHVYPRLVDALGDPEPIRQVRRRLLPLARGMVLEVGAGSGANFAHYDSARVTKLYALEPNATMVRMAERRRDQVDLDIEFLGLPGEAIPLADDAVDTVVSTFTLCSIAGVFTALAEARRVLRPGGRLIFFEHAISPDPGVRRWQERWAPIQHRLFEGLRLMCDAAAYITEGGFEIQEIDTAYLASFPKSWTYFCWGTATRGTR